MNSWRHWFLILDADVILPSNAHHIINTTRMKKRNRLYGVHQLQCQHYDEWLAYKRGEKQNWYLKKWLCMGYFQLFHSSNLERGVRYEPFSLGRIAGDRRVKGADFWFSRHFKRRKLEFNVIHLPHGYDGRNWEGRRSRSLKEI